MQANWTVAAVAALVGSVAVAHEAPQQDVIRFLQSRPEARPARIVGLPDGPASAAFAVAQETDKGLYTVGDEFDVKVEAGPHWIGLGCNAAPESLRSQLGLGEAGVVVYDIVDKSPAQAAGFQKHDLLIKVVVGEQEISLKDAPDLVRVVKEANLKPIKVIGVRSGKPLTLEVVPAERPQPQGAGAYRVLGHAQGVVVDPEKVQQLLKDGKTEELKEYIAKHAKEAQAGMRLHMSGPVVSESPARYGVGGGFVTNVKTATTASFPENLSITITRNGNEPAKFKVKRGAGEEWGATENELNTLPDDLRKHVEGMLHSLASRSQKERALKSFVGGSKTAPMAPMSPQPVQPPTGFPGSPPGAVPASPVPPGFGAGGGGFGSRFGGEDANRKQQQQLERLEKQIEELRHMVEKLTPKN